MELNGRWQRIVHSLDEGSAEDNELEPVADSGIIEDVGRSRVSCPMDDKVGTGTMPCESQGCPRRLVEESQQLSQSARLMLDILVASELDLIRRVL